MFGGKGREKMGLAREKRVFFIKMLAEWENVCIFVVEKS